MRIRSVYYSARFAELFQKLPREIQEDAVEAEKRFRDNGDILFVSVGSHSIYGL